MGRQSNFLAQIDNEAKTGGNINDHLAVKLLQSKGSWRNAMSSLMELKGFLHEKDDTLEEIVSDLLQKIENKEDVTKHVKNLLQGINDNMMKERPCYNCKETGTHMKGENLCKCNSCHGTLKKKPLSQKSRKVYISGIREILRFFGVLNGINERNLILKQGKTLKEKKYALEKKTALKIVNATNTSMRRVFQMFLAMTGCRLGESIQLKPEHFSYVDKHGKKTTRDKMFRLRVDLPANITKTGVERYVLIHRDIQEAVLNLVDNTAAKTKWQKHSHQNEYAFHTANTAESAYRNEERAFHIQRERMINDGHDFMGLQYLTGRHKITLHTFRSMFITLANRVSGSDISGDFGDHMAGHQDGAAMKGIYDRMPDDMVMELWLKAEPLLSLENNSSEEIELMQNEIKLLKEQAELREEETKKTIAEIQERHIEELAKQQVELMESLEEKFELKKKSKK